jgi:inorganic pyrophosphatase
MNYSVILKTIFGFSSISLLIIFAFLGCEEGVINQEALVIPESRSGQNYHCFVEVSAGDNVPIHYDAQCHCLDTLKRDSLWAVLPYLPYPVNRGFIPVTGKDSTITKIPAWILGKRLLAGTYTEVSLLGYMDYTEDNVAKSEVLVVPVMNELITVPVTKFKDFIIEYDAVKYAIEHWLRNRNGLGKMTFLQWEDEQKAREFVEQLINNKNG